MGNGGSTQIIVVCKFDSTELHCLVYEGLEIVLYLLAVGFNVIRTPAEVLLT